MKENCILLINAGPQFNRGLEKTPGQNYRFLNMRGAFDRDNTISQVSHPIIGVLLLKDLTGNLI